MSASRLPRRRPVSSILLRAATCGALAVPAGLWLASLAPSASTAVNLAAFGTPVVETFDTMLSAGTGSILPFGWALLETGSSGNVNQQYTAGPGSSNAGDVYSFGAAGSTDRAFGTLLSGTLTPTIGARLVNNTGGTITSLTIGYTGEQWRLGQSGRGPDRLDFQISTTATSLGAGAWTDYDALDFISPVSTGTVGALNGNVAPNRTAISATITGLSIPSGAQFWIRWQDFNVTGADDGLGIDEVSITPAGGEVVLPSLTVTDVTVNEGNAGTTSADFTVRLSSPAGPGGVTFDIATSDGTATAASGDYASRALTGQTIPAGSTSYVFTVVVGGDPVFEPTEDFLVTVSNVTGATVVDAQGEGRIVNDDSACGTLATPISSVQGSGATSPLVGAQVSVEAVVTGDFQANQLQGFYLQEEDADRDADPATSEGLFVFSAAPVAAGDRVRVTGTVVEFPASGSRPLTEVTNAVVEVCATGQAVTPTDVTLPVEAIAAWESLEGMLVRFAQPLAVTDTFTLGRFGEVGLSVDDRLRNPTQVVAPGAAAIARQDLNDRSRIVLDDARTPQNAYPTLYPAGGLTASRTLRLGDRVAGPLLGILDDRFDLYRVQPLGAVAFTPTNPRPMTPASVGGSLRVASINLLNYFNGDGLGGGFPTSRGADSAIEFARQRAKTISTLAALDADIVSLNELENDPAGNSAIEDLVGGLNAATAPGTYAFIDTGVVGTDLIRVGLLYKPAVVTPLGPHAVLTTAVDPAFLDAKNRPSLAQTFTVNANAARLTVVANHFKSKGADCVDVGDVDTGDGQGNCNATRRAAAEALVRWLATDPTGSAESDVIVLGDLNAYRREDPITALTAGGYVNLLDDDASYSYAFEGQSGTLDYALASPSLAPQVTGVTHWHVNADEPVALDYNRENKPGAAVDTLYAADPFRSADHDPIVVGLELLPPFEFGGFEPPVGGPMTEATAGRALPVKFTLGGDKGLDIFAAGFPASVEIACGTNPPLVPGDVAETAGGSRLQYDPVTGLYTFVWKTDRSWAGTCRRFTLKFTDGTWHRTDVFFRP